MTFCANLFLRGMSYREISAQLNSDISARGLSYTITAQTVHLDIRSLLVEWKKERADDISEYIERELRKLDRMEVELWDAWDKSKTGKQRDKTRTGDKCFSETGTETTTGDPRYMALLLDIQRRRAKMLGLDSPVKVEIPGVNVADAAMRFDLSAVPDADLFKIADAMQSAENRKLLGHEEKADTAE